MQVRLLKNVLEDGKLKVTKKRNKNYTPPKIEGDKIVISPEEEFIYTPFLIGEKIEMSRASAEKYIEKGLAEEVE